ncbi:Ff.00g120090.m01.CDS01 [Fusarium sp. VM40]|nr:Ff.00g120090.m01.CDS01 [Fusarium sp. VM40]
MPPIPIHTESPITAEKPSGITPKTAHSDNPAASAAAPASNEVPTSTYPVAQPGARPSMPAPTGAPQPPNIQPTPTRTVADPSPPAPQPGAVPEPQTGSYLPPPPKVGETLRDTQTQATPVQMPPQMSYAPLSSGTEFAAARSSTITAPGPSPMAGLGPTAVLSGGSGSDFSHPPGYHQNVHASEFSSSQRAAHEASVAQERRPSLIGDDEGEGVWSAAKKWASAAGDSLAAAENEVWKRINKEK